MDELKPMEWNDGSSAGNEIMPTVNMLSASAMEQRNEPTTEEIVKALRCEGDVDKCKDCYFENTEIGCVLCSGQEIESLAAARLEQLERDLETFKAFHERYAQQTSKKYVEDICALTARAEQAERERINPQPLTWEELSGMVGEPVWTIGECCGLDGWDIIEEVYDDSVLFGRSAERPERWNYNLRELSGKLSACAWLAYRAKPEGEGK